VKSVGEGEFQAWADKYGLKHKRTCEFKAAYEAWRFSLIELEQYKVLAVRELNYLKKDIENERARLLRGSGRVHQRHDHSAV
jgi:hypothetical protein